MLAAVGVAEEHERELRVVEAAVLGRMTDDVEPSAAPPDRAGRSGIRGHHAVVALGRVVDIVVVVAGGDVDDRDAGATPHGFDQIGLHEQQVVILVRDDREIVRDTERRRVRQLVVTARSEREEEPWRCHSPSTT